MILHTLTFMAHIMLNSLKSYETLSRVVNYLLPSVRNYGNKAIATKSFNTKHLKKGDPLPPYNGVLRLYNMRYCPWAHRSVLVLNAKELPYEVVNVNLADKPEWLVEKSPLEKVPAIEIKEGQTVYESSVVAEYLDEVYPERPLTSSDPLRRAQDKMIVEHFMNVLNAFFKAVKKPETVTDAVVDSYFTSLTYVQSTLNKRGTKFLFGDKPGNTDYMIWPWLERLPSIVTFGGDRFQLEKGKFYTLLTYIENMKSDPAVSQYLLDGETHNKFLGQFSHGNIEYDFNLQ